MAQLDAVQFHISQYLEVARPIMASTMVMLSPLCYHHCNTCCSREDLSRRVISPARHCLDKPSSPKPRITQNGMKNAMKFPECLKPSSVSTSKRREGPEKPDIVVYLVTSDFKFELGSDCMGPWAGTFGLWAPRLKV